MHLHPGSTTENEYNHSVTILIEEGYLEVIMISTTFKFLEIPKPKLR